MLLRADNLRLAADSIRAHKLRATLTILGLSIGVATLIAVMTLIQGANLYVELKIANLGTNVFRIARVPFAVADFNAIIKALRNKLITTEDLDAVARGCVSCEYVGASASTSVSAHYHDRELDDVNLIGHTATMAWIDTRTVTEGRYFTEMEERHAAPVCLIGDRLLDQLFGRGNAIGRTLRVGAQEFTVIGIFERIGSVLGQEQDNFLIVPLPAFLRFRGTRNSVTIEVKAGSGARFERAQDEARMILRTRRQITGNREEDFFIGTAENYISLWQSISSAFFAVFVMVSSISAVVGGVVIMNVMLVSVTERTKEIGVRRAVGATQSDILRQFLAESVMMCVVGGIAGVSVGFACAVALREFTSFPAAVRAWVAVLGVVLACGIGLFFGIYPATKAARLDPVAALRAE